MSYLFEEKYRLTYTWVMEEPIPLAESRKSELSSSDPGSRGSDCIKLGSYAEIMLDGQQLVKSNIVGDSTCSEVALEEAKKRVALTEYYHDQLIEADVTLPQTYVCLGRHSSGAPTVEIHAQKISAPNALIKLPTAHLSEQVSTVRAIMKEVVKIIRTQYGDRPIGYDTGFDNFIVVGDCAYLVDIYPPRVAHSVATTGECAPLEQKELLIGYPEAAPLSPKQEEKLKNYYYTPNGTIQHFTLWALAVTHCLHAVAGAADLMNTPRSREITAVVYDVLQGEGTSSLVSSLKSFLISEGGQSELLQFYTKAQERYAIALRTWRTVCHLF